MATLKQLAGKVGFSFKYGAKLDYEKQDEWQRKANGYRCTLTYQRRRYSFDYWQGQGITHDPREADCLDSLLSDAQAGEQSFAEFCGDFGYDEDSRKAEQTWEACQRTAKAMRRLLGEDFESFLYADRND